MAEDLVLYDTREKVGFVTLNRPDKLNAISKELRTEARNVLRKADEDPSTSVVVLRGAGRAFCAGYDIGTRDPERDSWRHDALRWHAHLSEGIEFEMTPWYMRKPVIASVQGYALGGGCELAMFCDLTIAAEDARLGEPEIRFSDTGPGIVMPWIIGFKRARELLYFGDTIDAHTAQSYGMVNRVVPAAELSDATFRYATRLALIAPEALVVTKLSINRGADAGGFRNAMMAGLDIVAPLYAAATEVGLQFAEITRTGIGRRAKMAKGAVRGIRLRGPCRLPEPSERLQVL